MKVYQSIHKYVPHIPAFEAKHGITDDTQLSFNELQQLIISDGYAAVYRLEPPINDSNSDVFFTIWNYERLQRLWAKEHDLSTDCSMNDIRVAQVKWFKPDVIYDFSGRYRPDFIEKLKKDDVKAIYALWNGVIEQNEVPVTIPGYDVFVSLHRPYIDYWNSIGFKALELQPAIPPEWHNKTENTERNIDILMYGQSNKEFFKARDEIIKSIIKLKSKYNVSIKLQVSDESNDTFQEDIALIEPPVYGSDLYDCIKSSKIVINKCTDNNLSFKSNMRVFEAIGNGALLLTEKGYYPEKLEPNNDYLTYDSSAELLKLIEEVLTDWNTWSVFAENAKNRLANNFSKEKQWRTFIENITNV